MTEYREHGHSGYKRGCRCEVCREAKRSTRGRRAARARERLTAALASFGNSCQECGVVVGKKPHDYELHHVDPETKEMEPTEAAWHASKERWLAELAKCVLLCPPCHWGEVT